MALAAIISSTASTCRSGRILRSTRATSGLNCWSRSKTTAPAVTPSKRFTRLSIELMSRLKARAKRSFDTPRSIARRSM